MAKEKPFFEDPELLAHAHAFLARAKALGCEAGACVALTEDEAYARTAGDMCDACFGAMVHQLAHVRAEVVAGRLDEAEDAQPEARH